MSKVYRITRFDSSDVDCRVYPEGKASHQLEHVKMHSPSGFNCGYCGSGPADLALSILTDLFEEDPEKVLEQAQGLHIEGKSRALELHQHFKRDVITLVVLGDRESYDLKEEQIRVWVEEEHGVWH